MKEHGRSKNDVSDQLIRILEKQKQDLVVRVLRKHEEVEAGKLFTSKVLASLSDLFFLLSADFQIVQANREFYRCLGYDPSEVLNLTLPHITGQGNLDLIRNALSFGEFNNLEIRLKTKSGDEIPVSLKGSTYITESGRKLHMLVASDRSDFHAMMSRMLEAQEQLIHSGRLASLGEMAAGIGHELTQPLNAILLFARNCIRALEDLPGNRDILGENLNIIIDRVNKASTIIRSLKSFAGKADHQVTPVSINAILLDILNFLDSQLTLSDIELELRLDDTLPRVLGQDVKLEQVFLNLIQNAILSMGKTEYPRLTITTLMQDTLDPLTLTDKTFVVVSIQDNGEGMDPAVQKKIFDPFFTTREVGTGMGLGLSIVDRIVRSFSGYVKVESSPGNGACFSVFLPECE
ncbi:MAG: ATP-binding protein [Desulfobulbaceae bacterium]|nr:ATP-binding protein [Desulfobulbaceae bacterium]